MLKSVNIKKAEKIDLLNMSACEMNDALGFIGMENQIVIVVKTLPFVRSQRFFVGGDISKVKDLKCIICIIILASSRPAKARKEKKINCCRPQLHSFASKKKYSSHHQLHKVLEITNGE